MVIAFKQKILISLIIVAGVIYVLLTATIYKKSQNELLENSYSMLLEVIGMDMHKRLTDSAIPFYYFPIPKDTTTQIAVQKEGHPTVYIEKTDSIRQLSFTEKQNYVFQSVLFYENPICVNTLDSLFQVELHRKKIKAQTVILYTDNTEGKTYYSTPDSLSYMHFSALPKINLGIEEEITLQAFLKISFPTIIRHAQPFVIYITLVWLIVMVILLFLFLKKDYRIKIMPTVYSETIKYKITDNILLDTVKSIIVYNSTEIELTLQIARFLEILLQSPDKFVTYEKLIEILYGGAEKGGLDRLN
ncbi:hypothetical protein LJC57_06805, partial [Parabacteroides sp. OttesenSCG-928-G07]|nr:hypothetical protein [Parabacteroides sp. OttesenSCG-928-G07]